MDSGNIEQLEKYAVETQEQVDLLQKRVDTLGKDFMDLAAALGCDSNIRAVLQRVADLVNIEREYLIRVRLEKVPEMTPEQWSRQRESFAFGNVKVDEPDISRPLKHGGE